MILSMVTKAKRGYSRKELSVWVEHPELEQISRLQGLEVDETKTTGT